MAKSRDPLFGPLGSWELIALARHGQASRARLIVLYLVFIALIVTPIFWFTTTDPIQLFTGGSRVVPIGEMAWFADRFAVAVLEAILLAVVAMTPGYAASAIAEEKEQRTLLLLLTTNLSDREIVMGKAIGRLGFVLASVGSALPILMGTILFGGVSVWFLLAGGNIVVATTVLMTAVGTHAACTTKGMRSALMAAYGMATVVMMLTAPFAVIIFLDLEQDDPMAVILSGIAYPGVLYFSALFYFHRAVNRLRSDEAALDPDPRPVRQETKRLPLPPPMDAASDDRFAYVRIETRSEYLPPIDEDNPVLWKERYVSGMRGRDRSGGAAIRAMFCILAGILLLSGVNSIFHRHFTATQPGFQQPAYYGQPPDMGGFLLLAGGTFAAGLYLFPVAIGLASAVARERQRHTLDELLTLPLDRRDILRDKIVAVIERGWVWGVIATLALTGAFGFEGGRITGMLACTFALTGILFVVGIGTLMTAYMPTEMRSFRFTVPAVVGVVGLPVAIFNQTEWSKLTWTISWLGGATAVLGIAGYLALRYAGRKFSSAE